MSSTDRYVLYYHEILTPIFSFLRRVYSRGQKVKYSEFLFYEEEIW